MPSITLPDGSQKSVDAGARPLDRALTQGEDREGTRVRQVDFQIKTLRGLGYLLEVR